MNIKLLVSLLCLVPFAADAAAPRRENARVGVQRVSMAGTRTINSSGTSKTQEKTKNTTPSKVVAEEYEDEYIEEYDSDYSDEEQYEDEYTDEEVVSSSDAAPKDCREAYRSCMDEFCLLDESEGYRCACSSKIEASKSLIQEIQKIQEEADKLYTEGVEREKLGAKAKLVFGESDAAKKSSRASGLSFSEWLNSGSDEDSLDSDDGIGDNLYAMAYEYCSAELDSCSDKAEMEEMLYSRQITSDCKAFGTYLADQKTNAMANKRTAEAAVRQARLAMLDTTNKYNRGECLLAYRACIADKGGCGTNFENCLDAELLSRRSYACENVLDQCMAVKKDVLQDWEMETESILADAVKYADKYRRQTCLAQIQVCLEDGCSTTTNSACLTDVNVAAGVCPIITECDEMIPGLKAVINDKLGYLRTQFCQNDIDACLRDKCGENFTAPECVGKKPQDIVKLCPQNMFPSCKNEKQYDIIVSAAVLDLDYQMMQGCINYFAEQLGKSCGTDMSCLPSDAIVESLMNVPKSEEEVLELRASVRDNARVQVEEFFKKFEKDKTVAACVSAQQPEVRSRAQMGDSVFASAKLIAEINAEARAMRQLDSKISELARKLELKEAEKACYATYKVEEPKKSEQNYTYIRSVSFEPSLRNCHVCRMQQVCETGGENKWTAGIKGAAGGLSAGASMGTMVSPGWGTLIGGVVGAVGTGLATGLAAEEKEYCQQIEACEDINM